MKITESFQKMAVGTTTELTCHTPNYKEKTHFVAVICNELQ